MSAADYNKAEVVDFGGSIGNLIVGVTGNGLGADDLDKAITAVVKGAKTVNEFKDVPEAAGLHTLGAASDVYGDHLLQKKLDEEAATEGGG